MFEAKTTLVSRALNNSLVGWGEGSRPESHEVTIVLSQLYSVFILGSYL